MKNQKLFERKYRQNLRTKLSSFPNKYIFRILTIMLLSISNTIVVAQKRSDFDATQQPQAPDYSLPENWSALPFRVDAADAMLKGEEWIDDAQKKGRCVLHLSHYVSEWKNMECKCCLKTVE